MNQEEIEKLRNKIEDAKTNRDKSQGAIDQIKERLKKEFDCSSIEEAESILNNLEKQIDSHTEKIETLEEEIESKLEKYENYK
ncbi:MAG: hypothetical protein ACFFDN_02025 [Candidatus Hodarchaeota archaeon]